jgi:hypothetical protein
MIVMLDTSQDLDVCASEIGCEVEQLLTPLTRYSPQQPDKMFAIDNGAFSKFNPKAFIGLLEREKPRRKLCRFVCAPDVVGSAIRTLEVFEHWHPKLSEWPIALVAQDGQESHPIPWDRIDAIFIGGSTDWKMGPEAAAIVKASKAVGKWCHAGRVNTPGRFEYFEKLGADSIDGTGLSRYTHMREKIYRNKIEPLLQFT